MSPLQIEDNPHEFEQIGADVAEAEDTSARSQRSALYQELRQRDAWLRKAWGRASPAVELQ